MVGMSLEPRATVWKLGSSPSAWWPSAKRARLPFWGQGWQSRRAEVCHALPWREWTRCRGRVPTVPWGWGSPVSLFLRPERRWSLTFAAARPGGEGSGRGRASSLSLRNPRKPPARGLLGPGDRSGCVLSTHVLLETSLTGRCECDCVCVCVHVCVCWGSSQASES